MKWMFRRVFSSSTDSQLVVQITTGLHETVWIRSVTQSQERRFVSFVTPFNPLKCYLVIHQMSPHEPQSFSTQSNKILQAAPWSR